MSWASLSGQGIRRWVSQLEGDRFGLSVARVVVGADTKDVENVRDEFVSVLDSATEDLVIARWPAHLTRLGAAAASSRRRVIPADMLTYWEAPAAALAATDGPRNGFTLVRPTSPSEDVEAAVKQVVRDSFQGYGNHYTANPALDPDLALAGYLEWAVGAFRADPGNVVILREGAVPIGVSTLTQDGGDLEIELAGLIGAAQGRGLYGPLLAAVGEVAVERGLGRVIISTQVHNVRVQRAWVRAGMKPFAAVTTVHLPLA